MHTDRKTRTLCIASNYCTVHCTCLHHSPSCTQTRTKSTYFMSYESHRKITLPPAPAVAFVCSYNSYFPFSLLVAYAHPYIHHMKTCIIIQIYYKCANSHPFPSTHPVNHLFVNAYIFKSSGGKDETCEQVKKLLKKCPGPH